jgi:bifunctional non-homologous end joining protein LigD
MNGKSPLQSVSRYFREGNSDKVYHAQLEQVAGGYVVNFQYGRRGSSLQAGTKTTTPVTLAEAEKVYARLLAEKKGKGYTEGASGTPYSGAGAEKQPSGYLPQLANLPHAHCSTTTGGGCRARRTECVRSSFAPENR